MNVVINTPDIPNKNGRTYPRALWEKLIADPELQNRLKNRTMFGWLVGSGGSERPEHQNLSLASHIVTNIQLGDTVTAEIEVLDTPQGNILSSIINSVEFVTAGVGSLDENNVVQSDYKLTSIDAA